MALSATLHARGEGSFIFVLPSEENVNPTSLMVNLIMRVILGIVSIFLCIVPLKHLYHGGEFAAVIFIANLMVVNFHVVINALIWRNDDTDTWWPGYGICDLNPYVHNICVSLYVTCLLAIMRNLAHQVGLLRANPLTDREKRRRNLLQALIMFPLPIIQVAWVWPLTSQRFVVATLVGCAWSAWPSWPYIFFFAAAPVFVSVITAGYAILIFVRFREVVRTTQSALSSNRAANLRAQRTKRRLYLMVISILVPFLPIVITLAVVNIRAASPLLPFNYNEIHNHVLPAPWNTIIYFPSGKQEFAFLNNCYISILSSIPVFVFFGMTKNAMNDYRRACLRLGLGHLFPILYDEYDPDRDAYGSSALSSNATNATKSTSTTASKIRTLLSNHKVNSKNGSSGRSPQATPMQSPIITTSPIDVEQGHFTTHISTPVSTYATDNHRAHEDPAIQLPHRNPFLYRTHLNFSVPFDIIPSFLKKKPKRPQGNSDLPLGSVSPRAPESDWDLPTRPSHIQTRVWSEDEGPILGRTTPESDLVHCLVPSHTVMVETEVTRESHHR